MKEVYKPRYEFDPEIEKIRRTVEDERLQEEQVARHKEAVARRVAMFSPVRL